MKPNRFHALAFKGLLLIHLPALLLSCDKPSPEGGNLGNASGTVSPGDPGVFDPSPIILSPDQRRAAEWSIVGAWFKLHNPGDASAGAANLAMSPSSLVDATQGVWWGTRGETAAELASLFGIDSSGQRDTVTVPPAVAPPLGTAAVLEKESALWLDQGFSVLDSYGKLLEQRGLGSTRTVDWTDIAGSTGEVNRWASEATGGRIGKFLDEGGIKPPVAFVLTSLIHFKAGWAAGFDPAATTSGDFGLLDGSKVPVSYMRATRTLRQAALDAVTLVELPFAGGGHRMILAMPSATGAGALSQLEGGVAGAMPKWLEALKEAPVDLAIPRFEVTGDLEANPVLEALGVRRIFSDRDADFSGASADAGLKLDVLRQSARVSIDENGAEASAATAAVVAPKGKPEGVVQASFDRPFLFFILGQQDDLLFAGRMASPAKALGDGETPESAQ